MFPNRTLWGSQREGEERCLRVQGEPVSLKDTISTERGKSMQMLSEGTACFDRVRLDDFDPIKMLGQGKLGQVCLVRYVLKNSGTRRAGCCAG